MNKPSFDILTLIARPAAGKSEIIAYLKEFPVEERTRRFHIGKFIEIDDFPMLWTWFEEDAMLERMGFPRLHTDEQRYFRWQYLWDLLIERIGLEYQKKVRDIPGYTADYTTIIEFSRGSEHGGYQSAFKHFLPQMLTRMAVLYIDISWEESLRKNRLRSNPDKPDSILEHSLPDAKLERLYKEVDWAEVSAGDPRYITIQGVRVPYAVFDNADDVTTRQGEALGIRLEQTLDQLWDAYRQS